MNIFWLNDHPEFAAASHCDKHVIKMLLESCQLMSTAHRVLDGHVRKKAVLPKDTTHFLTVGQASNTDLIAYKVRDTLVLSDMFLDQKLYSATHQNHPCAVWCRQTRANYLWLHELAVSLGHEYTDRYGKIHKCESSGLLDILATPPRNIPRGTLTEPALAMPEEYKVAGDPVESYRNYYRKGKNNIATWKHGNIPLWF